MQDESSTIAGASLKGSQLFGAHGVSTWRIITGLVSGL